MRAVIKNNGDSAKVTHVLCVPYLSNVQIVVGTEEKWPDSLVSVSSGHQCAVTVLFASQPGCDKNTRVDIYPTTPEERKLIDDGYIHDNLSARYGRVLALFPKPDSDLHPQTILWEACDGCDGDGIRVPASPSCYVKVPEGYVILERCDSCQLFESDADAAKSRFSRVVGIPCAHGGEHVCVDLLSELGTPLSGSSSRVTPYKA